MVARDYLPHGSVVDRSGNGLIEPRYFTYPRNGRARRQIQKVPLPVTLQAQADSHDRCDMARRAISDAVGQGIHRDAGVAMIAAVAPQKCPSCSEVVALCR